MLFGYPVVGQQIEILNFFGISGVFWLCVLRIVSFVILAFALVFWYKTITKFTNISIAKFSVLAVIISPLIFVLGLIYPLICIKLLIFCIGVRLAIKNKIYFGALIIILILFNWQVLGDKASIFYKLNLKDAQTEVTNRISREDSVKETINMPLWLRRVTGNKYFISYKLILAEALPFFDFESIFFQEINPLSQKSVVIFYWPEIYFFILGIYYLYNAKNKKINIFVLNILLLCWIDFIFSEGSVFKRLVLVIFPLSLVVASGFYSLYIYNNFLSKVLFYIVSIFILFGFINSFYDLSIRQQYWLDNRPIAFEFWYKQLQKIDINTFDKVYITSIVGDSKPYCYFYLGKICDDKKFVFESFDLTKSKSMKSIYAGFAGEFVGSDFKNNIQNNWDKNSNFYLISKESLRDTIANKYGNDIGVVITN